MSFQATINTHAADSKGFANLRVAKIIAEHDNEIGFTLLRISSSQAECQCGTSNKQAEEFHLLPCGVILSMPGISDKSLPVFHVCNSTAAIVVSRGCFIWLQLSILHPSCRRVCGGGNYFFPDFVGGAETTTFEGLDPA